MKISATRIAEIMMEPLLKYHYFQPLTVDLSNRIFQALDVKVKAKRTFPELNEPGLAKYINYGSNEQDYKMACDIAGEYSFVTDRFLGNRIAFAFAIAEVITPDNYQDIFQKLNERMDIIIRNDEIKL